MSDSVLTFEHVAFDTITLRRRRGAGRAKRIRRLAGESTYTERMILKDVSFELSPGDALGVIARRRVTKEALVRLAIGSLLPDQGVVTRAASTIAMTELYRAYDRRLSVRQNIYLLGGAIGMSPHWIAENIDAIVAASGVEKSIDRYATSMNRIDRRKIAFSLAMAAQPAVIAVDRRFVVADEDFAEHAWILAEKLRDSGTAFLLAVDSLREMRRFCNEGIVIDEGVSGDRVPIADAIARYRGKASE